MKVLVLLAHPSEESFISFLSSEVIAELKTGGHEIRHHDLWAENFSPVFTPYERLNHVGDVADKLRALPELQQHIEDLQWCEALVLVYPTWWSGQPAMLKGWFDRVLMNGVAWVLPEGAARIRPLLTNVRHLIVVTTHGSGKFVNALEGESGKRTVFRSVRLMLHRRVRCEWIAMYGLDNATPDQRQKFAARARRRTSRVLG
jgi:putative NADPH-quinone reductase